MEETMQTDRPTIPERKELKVRITQSLYDRLEAECRECGCSMNAVVTLAIAREVANRKSARVRAAQHAILVGQLDIEGNVNA
jgi:hypothetical protein